MRGFCSDSLENGAVRKLVIALVWTVAVTACSNSATPTTTAMSPSEARVEIDPTGGELRIGLPSPEEGDGNTSTDLPPDFPMPVPDGGEIVNTVVSSAGERDDFHVIVHYPSDHFERLGEVYRTWLMEEGFDVDAAGSTEAILQLAGLGNRASASVLIAEQDGKLFVSLTYSE